MLEFMENTKDFVVSWAGFIAILMSLVQITPLKINPWTFIGNKINKMINGEILSEIEKLSSEIKDVEGEMLKQVAISCRSRILVFGDEIIRGNQHSKEHFNHILNDITLYEQYCNKNPNFLNNMTQITAERIKETYKECMIKNTFL